MLTRFVIAFTALAFAASAVAEETTPSSFTFLPAKQMQKDWLTDGFWLDTSKGVDCAQFAQATNFPVKDDAGGPDPKLLTYAIIVSENGGRYAIWPEMDSTCTFVEAPNRKGDGKIYTASMCSGNAGNQLYGERVTVISPSQVKIDKIGLDFATGMLSTHPEDTETHELTYCGKPLRIL